MRINSGSPRSYQGNQSGCVQGHFSRLPDPKFVWCPQPLHTLLLFCHGWLTCLAGPWNSLQGNSHESQGLCTNLRWKIKQAYDVLNNLKYDWYLGWCITDHCNQTSTSSFPLKPLSVWTALAVCPWVLWSWFLVYHLLSSVGTGLSHYPSIVPFPSLCQKSLFS